MNHPAVTHLDLMLYLDGELEPSREADVRAYLEQSTEAQAVVAGLLEVGQVVRSTAEEAAVSAQADGIANAVMRSLPQQRVDNVVSISARASEGKRAPLEKRSLGAMFGMAAGGLAAAAAVAFVAWRLAGVEVAQPSVSTAAFGPSPFPTELMVASATLPALDRDARPGVSVDAIDFGARTGTIFYVPTESGTTTVVWLSEEEGGGD